MRHRTRIRLGTAWIGVLATTTTLLAIPAGAGARELSIRETLDQLYGAGNYERVPDDRDQVWLNDGGTARARAKFTANPDGNFGYLDDDDVIHPLFTFEGTNMGFDVHGSGVLPAPSVLRQFRWVLSDLAIGGGPWSSRVADNRDRADHALTYRITAGESAGHYALFWEDLPDVAQDDFNDFVVEVSGVELAATPVASYRYTLKPSRLDFGNQALGTATSLDLWVRNKDTTTLPISGAKVVGASRYSLDNRCGRTLSPGASCSLRLTFSPDATGTYAADLRLGVGDEQLRVRPLTGRGIVSSFEVSPTSLTFGSVAVGTPAPAQVVTVGNPGATALSIASIRVAGANPYLFRIAHDCPGSLPPGASCAIRVTLEPTVRGTAAAQLMIEAGSGAARSVPLAGAAR